MKKNEKMIEFEQIKRIKSGQPSEQDLNELSRDEINRIQYGEFLTAIRKNGYSIKDVFDMYEDESPLIQRLRGCIGLDDIKKDTTQNPKDCKQSTNNNSKNKS